MMAPKLLAYHTYWQQRFSPYTHTLSAAPEGSGRVTVPKVMTRSSPGRGTPASPRAATLRVYSSFTLTCLPIRRCLQIQIGRGCSSGRVGVS